MNVFQRPLILGALTLLYWSAGYAQEVIPKSYNIFSAVPKSEMREMETDRPDVTESPFTVDAGHFQYEADLLRFSREKDELTDQKTVLFNQANLKLGITGSTDLQVVVQSCGRHSEIDAGTGAKTVVHGIGDITVRLKQNLLGNDKGKFAIAILPYLKFPASKMEDDSRYEAGLIIPVQVKLPGEWKLGLQVEADRLKNKYDSGLHSELLQSITISHAIVKGLDGIAETFYTYDFKQHHWANFINAALQMELAADLRIDAGLNYGIQPDAEKSYFLGTSFRF